MVPRSRPSPASRHRQPTPPDHLVPDHLVTEKFRCAAEHLLSGEDKSATISLLLTGAGRSLRARQTSVSSILFVSLERAIKHLCVTQMLAARASFAAARRAAAFALLWLAVAAPLRAQPINIWSSSKPLLLPEAGVAPSGFTIDLAADHLHRFGDIPLHVQVSPTGPTFVDDRQLQLRLLLAPGSVAPRNRSTSYLLTLDLPAGSGPLKQTFYLPKWVLGGTLVATVLEAGQPLPGYRGELGPGGGRGEDLESAWMESVQGNYCWIAAPGSTPLANASQPDEIDDLRILLAAIAPELLTFEQLYSPQAAISILRQYGPLAGLQYRTAEQVPADWKGVSQSHVWITRWSTYRWLEEHRPEAALALRQFVRCGGALWLLEVDDQQTLQTHFQTAFDPTAFDASNSETDSPEEQEAAEVQPLTHPDFVLHPAPQISAIVPPNHLYGSTLRPRRALAEQVQAFQRSNPTNQQLLLENMQWLHNRLLHFNPNDTFVLQLGIGIIVGNQTPNSLSGPPQLWQSMLERSEERTSSVLTRGIDPIAGDNRFWNWVIPGVAQPPVYTFIGLLIVFVILVGPVAYRKLNRMGRSYLMFLVAPVLAFATTLFLVTYGLLADGLGTQARIRQITWVCDRDGGAMRYWRSTYFAGIRPSEGLHFPANSRLEPYYISEFNNWYDMTNREGMVMGNITLSQDSLRLSSGFLPSRQQRQFMAYRPLEKVGGLGWSAETSGKPRAENRFDYALREIILRDADGQYWELPELAAGHSAALTPIAEAEISRRLSDLYVRNRLELPEGLSLGYGRRRPMELISRMVNGEPWRGTLAAQRVSGSEGWLEWHLQDMLQTSSTLRPGTFIALADVTEDCIAIPSATLVQSIHYVLGELQ